MIDVEIKRPHFKLRAELEDLSPITYKGDGTYKADRSFTVICEFVSVGLFGKRYADISEDECAQLDTYSSDDLADFCTKVKGFIGNPGNG